MRKTSLLVALMILMGISLSAKQVDTEEARTIAQRFLQQQPATRAAGQSLRLAYTANDGAGAGSSAALGTNLFYVFNRGNDGGFVVVAGDDRMRPILGFTDSGAFDINTANYGLQWWLDAVSAKAKAIANGSDNSVYASSTRSVGSSVEPLVKTQWNQYAPYNNLCPADNTDGNGQRSVTGCVATAMAQILYHCYSPATQSLSGTVTCRPDAHASATTDVDLSQYTIDYGKMELTYDGDESAEANNAVATLMYACGLSVNMNYCVNGSNSAANPYVFMKYFGIDNGCRKVSRTQFTNDAWDALICSELDNGRPVLYSGSDIYNAGHAFICDGYNSDGLYHINWGWGGYGDGYFDFYSLDFQYILSQDMVYGIKPGTGDLDLSSLLTYSSLSASLTDEGNSINLCYDGLTCSGAPYEGAARFAFCDGDAIKYTFPFYATFSVKDGNYSYGGWNVTMPNNLADGKYTLRLLAGKDYTTWKLIEPVGDRGTVTLTVSGGVASIDTPAPLLTIDDSKIGDDGTAYVGKLTKISVTIKNTGSEFYGVVNNYAETMGVIKPGENKTYELYVTPTETGTATLAITAYDYYTNQSFTVGEIKYNVDDATAIDAIAASEEAKVSVSGNSVVVTGIVAGAPISVYTATGSLVKVVKADKTATRISGLSVGQLYIIRANGCCFKVML